MSDERKPNFGNPASTDEQIPHSGVHHDERPVEEFDMTLAEAKAAGKLSELPPAHPNPPEHDTLPPVLPPPAPEQSKTEPREVRGHSRRTKALAWAAGLLVVAGGTGGVIYNKVVSPMEDDLKNLNPDTANSAPVTPGEGDSGPEGNQNSSSVDIIVQDLGELDEYTLAPDLNPTEVFREQDKAMNEIIAKLAEDPTYRYADDLKKLAVGDAIDHYDKVIKTVSTRFRDAKQQLRDRGISEEEISTVTASIQTIPEGDPRTAGAGYEQDGLMTYWLSDDKGNDRALVENEFPVTYQYREEVAGDPEGTSPDSRKNILVAEEFTGQF